MSTLHALFPVKLLSIIKLFEKSKRGSQQIELSNNIKGIKLPADNRTRAVLSSAPLFNVIQDDEVTRIRLAYYPNIIPGVHQTQLELYTTSGDLLKIIKYPDWSMSLSLAIEAELLERVCNINPL